VVAAPLDASGDRVDLAGGGDGSFGCAAGDDADAVGGVVAIRRSATASRRSRLNRLMTLAALLSSRLVLRCFTNSLIDGRVILPSGTSP
jgi:hypothetical protein